VDRNVHPIGLLDTSVIIDIHKIELSELPNETSISTLTFAELSAGIPVAPDAATRAIRQQRLQTIEALTEVLPFEMSTARAYASVYAVVQAQGRKPRGGRAVDYMIAATALDNNLPLFTRNPKDFVGIEDLIDIVTV
jgi:predicted nucleic acid-binding protein